MIYLALAAFLLLNIAALVSIAAWYRRDRADLTAERDQAVRDRTATETAFGALTEERDGLVLLCETERERAQIAETELYGHLVDCHEVTPIAAVRAVRRP